MKAHYFIILLALFAIACSHHEKVSENLQDTSKHDSSIHQKPQVQYIETHEDTTPVVIDTTKKLLGYSFAHSFSDSATKDIFKINLYGKSIVKGAVVFEIYNHSNTQIFKEIYRATDLLGDLDDLTVKQQQDTIQNRMAHFLDESSFIQPAIDAKAQFDQDNSDKAIWKDIKADQTAIGFFYTYGYEGIYEIAYSKTNKKVVLCFSSD